jgi:hypothetical protein
MSSGGAVVIVDLKMSVEWDGYTVTTDNKVRHWKEKVMVYFMVLSWQPHRQKEPGLNRSCDKPKGCEWELIPLLLYQTRLNGCRLNYFVGLQNWEPIGCPTTSVTIYQPYVALNPEKRIPQVHSSGNLQCHIAVSDIQKTNWQQPRDMAFLFVITTYLRNFMFCWPYILVQLWANDQLDVQLPYI